jgi:hypothetical protein
MGSAKLDVVRSGPSSPISSGPEAQCYLAEVRLRVGIGTDLSWLSQSLGAACGRFHGVGPSPQILSMVHVPDDDRLLCLVKALNRDDVLGLFEISLLPSARVVEVVVVVVEELGLPQIEPG